MLCAQQTARLLGPLTGVQKAGLAGLLQQHLFSPIPIAQDNTPSPVFYSSRSGRSGKADVHSTTVLCVRKDGQVIS